MLTMLRLAYVDSQAKVTALPKDSVLYVAYLHALISAWLQVWRVIQFADYILTKSDFLYFGNRLMHVHNHSVHIHLVQVLHQNYNEGSAFLFLLSGCTYHKHK